MSVLKNQKNQKSLFKVNIFIFIIQIIFLIIKCEGDEVCSCSCTFNTTSGEWIGESCDNCIYHLEDNSTYCCQGINKTKNYIYKESACIQMDSCPNKVVKETKECVPRCLGNSYELGDECYLTYDNNTMICQEYPIRQCQCLSTYYTEKNEVTKEIHYFCKDSDFNCSTYNDYYKDSDKNQCVPKSDCENKLIREDIKRCSYECEVNEFKYTEIYTDNAEKTFCYGNCPEKAPFYYFNSISNISICHDSCDNEDFNDDYKCVSKCPEGKVHLIDLSDNIKRNCSSEEASIINQFPYKYNETNEVYYLKRCDDMKEMNIFNKRQTYYLNEGGINKCVDNCPNYILDGTNNCTNCSEVDECLIGNKCFKYNTENRTDNKYFMIENFDSTQPNECTQSCPANYYIDKKNKRCNKYICENGYINPNNFECMETCLVPINPSSPNPTNGEGFIYKDKVNITENLILVNRTFCYPSCFINGTQMHYLFGDNKCFENECKYYKEENGKVNPKYSAFNNSYVCYNSCETIGEGYNYQSDYICYSKPILCDEPYYYMEKGLKKCASYNDCKDKYHFKYILDKECVNECNNSLYYSYYDGQNLGECFSDPNECIKKGYPFFNNKDKICSRDCSNYKTSTTDPIINKNIETCFENPEDCPEPYSSYYSKEKMCYRTCPNYYYGKQCLDSCGDKYHFIDSKECLDNCGKTNYEPSNNTEKICYEKCPDNEPYIKMRVFGDTGSFYCTSKCPGETPFYYEETKQCAINCGSDLYKSNNVSEKICVKRCPKGEKIFNNYCVKDCSETEDAPFTALLEFSDKNPEKVEKCVSSCSPSYLLALNSTKKCVNECPVSESVIYKSLCYAECPNNTFYDALNNKCLDSEEESKCPKGLNYFVKNGDYYECKMSCPKNTFHPENGGECLERCEPGQKIGGNNFCLSQCNETTGEYYKTIDNEHNISQCVASCEDNLTVYDTNECVSECPPGYYKSEINKKCYNICNVDPDYPFSTEDDLGNLICDKKCNDKAAHYDSNLICRNNCSGLAQNIIDYDKACVSKCNNQLYKYLENYTCVKECSPEYYIIEKELKCVEECSAPYNYIVGKECREKCDEKHFKRIKKDKNGYNIYECVEKCESNEYYYETGSNKKICLTECQKGQYQEDFIIEETNICISTCNSSYYFYFYDGTNNSKYINNTCVKQCPKDKPFYDDNKNCLKSCRKFSMINDNKCIDKCPKGTIEVDSICTSTCPSNKFNESNICKDSCSNQYPYYIPGINYCLQDCDRVSYRKDGQKCVTSCNESSYYINETNTCVSNCQNGSYYIEYYPFEGFTSNSCFNQCPGDFPFYSDELLNQNGISVSLHVCKRDCKFAEKSTESSSNSFKCLDNEEFCPELISYYDPETKLCDSKCPDDKKYYITKSEGDKKYYECHDKCPKDTYINQTDDTGIECVVECGEKYLDYEGTNKSCVSSCENKKEFIDDGGIKYCLSNCSDLGLFTDNKKCVKECDHEKYLTENMLSKTCDCENLFYVNESEKICLESSKKCSNISNVDLYYRKYKEYECVKNCTGIISVNGDLCYPSGSQCPNNSREISNKCECSYKYYKDKNNQIICLGEKVECPAFYPYLKKTNECVEECGSDEKKFDNKCLNNDDFVGFETDSNPPTCSYKKYFNGTKYICTELELNCGNQYYIEDLNICVESCNNPEYFIDDSLNGKKNCVPTCNNSYSSITYINEKGTESYKCTCKYNWYKDNNNIYCSENKNITCQELTNSLYNFTNKSSNECIQQCNNYIFNNECFNNCEEVQKFYGINVIEDSGNKCKCKNLWKTIKIEGKDDKIECIEDLYCIQEGFKFLIKETKECVSDCISPFPLKFNHECYKDSCPINAYLNNTNNKCECSNYYFKYKDEIYNEDFINCLPSKECPLDYPYLKGNECINDSSSCIKEFNYECFDECPSNTKENSEGNKKCECDRKNTWRRYSKNNKEYFDCKVTNCTKIDNTTNECVNVCKEAQYIFKNNCYDRCPPNTRTADQTSKECIEIVAFDEAENLSDLNNVIKDKITEIYPTSSDGGIIYNMNNSTLQIYGVNKNKKENSELIMRSNLTYIDLSYCYDKLYGNGDLQEGDDIIIVKYDIGDKTNSLTINPVEFEALNSRTGDKIDLSVCDNSIVISYPITNILNNYAAEPNKLRNLEEKINNLNLKEKFLKGKELYLDDKDIDSFNSKNKLYTDICCPCEINGKDLILEDRFNYLYPLFSSFCESNCIYGRTDFIAERVICNCSPKSEIDFDRELTLQTNEASVKNAKDDQKGSILKCISKVSNIAKNFGFFYGLIILLVEIGMVILTILYSYKVFIMRVNKKFDISGNENNNIDTENIENINLRGDNKKTNENIKTSERHLEYPPKRNNKTNTNANKTNKRKERKEETAKTNKQNLKDPEVININKLKIKENNYVENEEKISNNSQSNDYYEKSSVQTMKEMEDESLFDLIKNEEKLLTVDYNYALRKNKAEIVVMVLTEVMDKIYLIKAIWFLQKYEIFSLYFSLYLLWHLLIISFLSLFYNNSTLHKIWIRDDYPDLNYHLGFGFVACIISFVFYRGLLFLINNDKKIKEIENINKENKKEIGEKCDKMIFWAKIKMIIFYAVVFLLVIIFFLYLTAFCGVYTGTSSNLIESYGIALIEVIIIKVLYGIVLGILRKISLSFEINILYTIVRFMDLYIS